MMVIGRKHECLQRTSVRSLKHQGLLLVSPVPLSTASMRTGDQGGRSLLRWCGGGRERAATNQLGLFLFAWSLGVDMQQANRRTHVPHAHLHTHANILRKQNVIQNNIDHWKGHDPWPREHNLYYASGCLCVEWRKLPIDYLYSVVIHNGSVKCHAQRVCDHEYPQSCLRVLHDSSLHVSLWVLISFPQ